MVLEPLEKDRVVATLTKTTDHVASMYFLAPHPENWVGTLKGDAQTYRYSSSIGRHLGHIHLVFVA